MLALRCCSRDGRSATRFVPVSLCGSGASAYLRASLVYRNMAVARKLAPFLPDSPSLRHASPLATGRDARHQPADRLAHAVRLCPAQPGGPELRVQGEEEAVGHPERCQQRGRASCDPAGAGMGRRDHQSRQESVSPESSERHSPREIISSKSADGFSFRSKSDCRPSIDELKSHLHSLGADHVLTYDEFLSRENNTRTKIKEWIGRDGEMRLALNCVGGKETAEMAKLLAMDGKLGGLSPFFPAVLAGCPYSSPSTLHSDLRRYGQDCPGTSALPLHLPQVDIVRRGCDYSRALFGGDKTFFRAWH